MRVDVIYCRYAVIDLPKSFIDSALSHVTKIVVRVIFSLFGDVSVVFDYIEVADHEFEVNFFYAITLTISNPRT